MKRRLRVTPEEWALAQPFVIARATFHTSEVLVVEIEEDGRIGRGEGCAVDFKGETLAGMVAAIEALRPAIEAGLDREALQTTMAPGGARNALDCALWALEAQWAGVTVAALCGLANAGFRTVTTLSLAEPAAMAAAASLQAAFAGLKVKLNADRPVERIAAIRAARPEARLICDVNGAWTREDLRRYAPELARLGVELIEQPLAAGEDAFEAGDSPIPVCADESCCSLADLDRLPSGYGGVCVKLDKAGGLTEALAIAGRAKAKGMRLLVSNMLGTSLGMAPASLLAPMCDWVDLDGPLLLRSDRKPGLIFRGDHAVPYESAVWA